MQRYFSFAGLGITAILLVAMLVNVMADPLAYKRNWLAYELENVKPTRLQISPQSLVARFFHAYVIL